MPKRSWNEAAESHSPNDSAAAAAKAVQPPAIHGGSGYEHRGALAGAEASSHSHKRPAVRRPSRPHRPSNAGDDAGVDDSFSFAAGPAGNGAAADASVPMHRKAKACVACRRQKVSLRLRDVRLVCVWMLMMGSSCRSSVSWRTPVRRVDGVRRRISSVSSTRVRSSRCLRRTTCREYNFHKWIYWYS